MSRPDFNKTLAMLRGLYLSLGLAVSRLELAIPRLELAVAQLGLAEPRPVVVVPRLICLPSGLCKI